MEQHEGGERFRLSHPLGSIIVDQSGTERSVFIDEPSELDGAHVFVTSDVMTDLLDHWETQITKGTAVVGGYQVTETMDGREFYVATVRSDSPLVEVAFVGPQHFGEETFADAMAYELGDLPFEVTVDDETGQRYDDERAFEYDITTKDD